MIHGLDSHCDVGECLDCLIAKYGVDWQENAFNYDSDKMPRDMHYNGFIDFIQDEHPVDVCCWKCGKVWSRERKKWEFK